MIIPVDSIHPGEGILIVQLLVTPGIKIDLKVLGSLRFQEVVTIARYEDGPLPGEDAVVCPPALHCPWECVASIVT